MQFNWRKEKRSTWNVRNMSTLLQFNQQPLLQQSLFFYSRMRGRMNMQYCSEIQFFFFCNCQIVVQRKYVLLHPNSKNVTLLSGFQRDIIFGLASGWTGFSDCTDLQTIFKDSFFATSLFHVLSAIKTEMTDCDDDDVRCLYTLYNSVNVHFLASSKNMNLKHVSSFYFFVEGRNAIKRMNND